MKLCGADDFNGSLGAAFRCPICRSHPRDYPYQFGGRLPPPLRSLRVFVNVHHEVVVRCHFCGLAGTALELIRMVRQDFSWEHITEILKRNRVFGDSPFPDDWIARARKSEKFSDFFQKAKASYRRSYQHGGPDHFRGFRFGEIAEARGEEIERVFPELHIPVRSGRPGCYRLELRRSLLGLPLSVGITKASGGNHVAVVQLHPGEAMSLMVPDWALYRDWTEEILICTDYPTAVAIQDFAASQPESAQCPIAWVYNSRRPILDDLPFGRVRYVPGPGESAEFALAFAQGAGRVTVSAATRFKLDQREFEPRGLQLSEMGDALEVMAEEIVAVKEHGASPVAFLNAILDKPWVALETGRRLAMAVAARLGETADALIARSGASSHVLPFRTGKATYLCRNGIYIRARDRRRTDFQPCSNFSLQLLESSIGTGSDRSAVVPAESSIGWNFNRPADRPTEADRQVSRWSGCSILDCADGPESLHPENSTEAAFDHSSSHRLRLILGKETASFIVDQHDFEIGARLMRRTTRAAVEHGLSSLPSFSDPADVRLLPGLVRSTRTTARTVRTPVVLGFGSDGAFHGPDFTVTMSGFRRRLLNPAQLARSGGWMAPEGVDAYSGFGQDYLCWKASQLVSWLAGLNDSRRRTIGVILYAAIDWLHRGFRNRPACLLLPSRGHLDLLGRLLGLVPMEVGKSSRFPSGIPRLMAFGYWAPRQFRKEGRIVAAIEAPHHRIDRGIPIVVHRPGGGEPRAADLHLSNPKLIPPSSFLSLLASCCLGRSHVDDAVVRLCRLGGEGPVMNEDRRQRGILEQSLEQGSWYLAGPGGHLYCFLRAVNRHPRREEFLMETRRGRLLRRSIVGDLLLNHNYAFKGNRLLAEFRSLNGIEPPGRYGKKLIPVYSLPEILA